MSAELLNPSSEVFLIQVPLDFDITKLKGLTLKNDEIKVDEDHVLSKATSINNQALFVPTAKGVEVRPKEVSKLYVLHQKYHQRPKLTNIIRSTFKSKKA